jgi:hypothetical protein
MTNFNGLRTELAKNKKTVFVALPVEAWRPIANGCACPFCKTHPDLTPYWDTLVVNPVGVKDVTSVCHYPEFSR